MDGPRQPRAGRADHCHIGDGWLSHLEEELARLEPLAGDPGFQARLGRRKLANKRGLAALLAERAGVSCDPDVAVRIQVKRFHEYKRQHLNALHLVTLYNRIKQGRTPGPPEPSCSAARQRPATGWPS